MDTSSALGAFERMEEKVMSLEAQAEAAQMVSAGRAATTSAASAALRCALCTVLRLC